MYCAYCRNNHPPTHQHWMKDTDVILLLVKATYAEREKQEELVSTQAKNIFKKLKILTYFLYDNWSLY